MTKTTTEILGAYESIKTDLQKQISVVNLQKINKDTYLDPYNTTTNEGGYYNYVQNLDLLNEEYYVAITQQYNVNTASTTEGVAASETLLPEYADNTVLTVPDMKGNKAGVTTKCTETLNSIKKMNSLQVYLSKLMTLADDLTTCVDYLNKESKFDNVNWQV